MPSHTNVAIILERGLRSTFMRRRIEADQPIVGLIATVVQSDNTDEKYGFLGDIPQMREWTKQGRKITRLSEASYTLANRDYEATIEIDMNDLEDDQLGALAIRVRDLAVRAANHPVKLLIDTLVAGNAAGGEGYDTVTFFNDAHPARGEQTATQDNDLAGTGTTTAALSVDLAAAIASMRRVLDEANEPFTQSVDDLLIVAPPELEFRWREVLFSTIVSNTTNIQVGQADLYITSRLTDVDDWFLLNVGNEIKPLLWQERRDLTFERDETNKFNNKKILFGVDARYAAGYLLWQYATITVN